jgi:hypothetical protein
VPGGDPVPAPRRWFDELEGHGQTSSPRARPLGDPGPETDRREVGSIGLDVFKWAQCSAGKS